jgi:hypothetical protein
LTEVLRQGARSLLAQAIEAEVATFLAVHADSAWRDRRAILPIRYKSGSAALACR